MNALTRCDTAPPPGQRSAGTRKRAAMRARAPDVASWDARGAHHLYTLIMDTPQSLDAELMQALIVELIREGFIPHQVMERVQRRFEGRAQANAGNDRSIRYETLARIALSIQLEAEGPSSSDVRASQRRQQMHAVPENLSDDDKG